jgi:hypothetical protein
LIKVIKIAVLRGNRQKMLAICGDTLGNRLRRFPCFPLAGNLVGNAPISSPYLFGPFPKCICYSVSVAEKVSSTI